jgi:hypothetical protein
VASRIRVGTDVDVRGPLFDGRDGPIMRRFFKDAKKIVADKGVIYVRERLGRRAKDPTGAFSAAVQVHDYAKGRTIQAAYPQVLYGPWLEGTSTRNGSTRFKGYKMFRLSRLQLRREVSGLIQDRYDAAVAELNGGLS